MTGPRAFQPTRLAGTARNVGLRNPVTGRRRIPWRALDETARRRRYAQAVRGHRAGLPVRDPGTFEQYAAAQERLDAAVTSAPAPSHPRERRRPVPPFFGSPARTEILALLAANGPLTVREIARLRDVDSAATFRAVDALLESAIVAKRERPGGRKYVALNRAHPAYAELDALLREVAGRCRVPSMEQARYRWGLPLPRSEAPDAAASPALGSPVRARILVMLSLVAEADPTQLARLVAHGRCSVDYACKALRRLGVLRRRAQGGRVVYGLATEHPGADLYAEYLRAVAQTDPDNISAANGIVGTTRRWF